MSAPEITLLNSQPMTAVFTDTGAQFSYKLFADSFYFENWTDWVNDSVNKPTNTQKANAAAYSSYVLKFYCQLARQHNACGFKHAEHGAIFISSDDAAGQIVAEEGKTDQIVSNTYVMKKAEYTAWLASPANLSTTAFGVLNTSTADPYFQFFYCGGSRDHTYTCYKY